MRKPLSVCPVLSTIPTDPMLKILYIEEPDGPILSYDCYPNRYDRRNAYQYLLDEGYEIVGEA